MHDLHWILLWICAGIAVAVFGAMFYALVRYRRSRGAEAQHFHSNLWLELLWTAIPVAILVAIAIPATRSLLVLNDDEQADLTIQVTGFQWRWKYDYLDYEFSFFSTMATSWDAVQGQADKGEHYLQEVDQRLVLPVGRKIRILTTANDVIHSWWVPDLGVKRDAVPGFVNEAWTRIDQPGIYRGQCAELCGVNHGFMPIVVEALPPEEFTRWIESRQDAQRKLLAQVDKLWSRDELMTRGEQVYAAYCAACHQLDGRGQSGIFPGLRRAGRVMGPMAQHVEVVLFGSPGTAMQAYLKQLNDIDLAAVVTYERNAWGNDRFDMIQPREVRDLRRVREGGG